MAISVVEGIVASGVSAANIEDEGLFERCSTWLDSEGIRPGIVGFADRRGSLVGILLRYWLVPRERVDWMVFHIVPKIKG